MNLAVVIPAYNEETLIARCLEAVTREVARAGGGIDVIVVDNASTDRTAEIAGSFPGVRVVREEQKGLVHARAAGQNATTAELVAHVDADTLMPPGWIDTVRREFARDAKLVGLSGPYRYYDLNAVQRGMVAVFYGFAYLIYLMARYVTRNGSMIQGGNFVIARKAWDEVGGFDKTIAFYGEDTDVAMRLSKVGHVKWTFRLPMETSGRRLAEEGIMRTAGQYTLNFFSVMLRGRPATKTYTDIRPE